MVTMSSVLFFYSIFIWISIVFWLSPVFFTTCAYCLVACGSFPTGRSQRCKTRPKTTFRMMIYNTYSVITLFQTRTECLNIAAVPKNSVFYFAFFFLLFWFCFCWGSCWYSPTYSSLTHKVKAHPGLHDHSYIQIDEEDERPRKERIYAMGKQRTNLSDNKSNKKEQSDELFIEIHLQRGYLRELHHARHHFIFPWLFFCWSVQDGLARKDSIIRQVGFLRLFSMYIQFGCCRKVDRASSSVGSITGQKRNLWIGDDLSSSVIGWLIVRQTISSNSASRLFVLFLLRTAEVREDRLASSELVWVW